MKTNIDMKLMKICTNLKYMILLSWMMSYWPELEAGFLCFLLCAVFLSKKTCFFLPFLTNQIATFFLALRLTSQLGVETAENFLAVLQKCLSKCGGLH
jgi:hypothetical protein